MIYNYPYKEKFDTFEMPNLKRYSGNIVVWGAGKIGGVAAHCLKKKNIQVVAFCDVAEDKWGEEFCGYKIISPEQLKNEYPEAAVIISTVFHQTIVEHLKRLGYKNIFDCVSLFLQIDFEGYDFWMLPNYAIRNVEQYMATIYEQTIKDNEVDQIFLNITTKCSLRCRDCSMFIPYVSNPVVYDANIIMDDLFKVIDALGHVRVLNFYGGEPLLHPELSKMIAQLEGNERIDRISIITNATILPDEQLLNVLKKDKRVWMRISDYGVLSTKMQELKKMLEESRIVYEVANYKYWDAPSRIAPVNETEEELIAKFQQCTAGNNLFFLNRKLYLCSTGSAVDNMNVFPFSESNFVDVGKNGESVEVLCKELIEFLSRPKNKKYIDACKYCSGSHCVQFEDKRPVAVQTKERLEFDKLY